MKEIKEAVKIIAGAQKEIALLSKMDRNNVRRVLSGEFSNEHVIENAKKVVREKALRALELIEAA